LTFNELGDPDLAYRAHISVGSLNIDGHEVHAN
jgi:hypothetical protein